MDLILSALLQTLFSESERDRPRLCNEHAVKLAEARLSESVIVPVIELYDSDFDISRTALLNLRKYGTGMAVANAMLFPCGQLHVGHFSRRAISRSRTANSSELI